MGRYARVLTATSVATAASTACLLSIDPLPSAANAPDVADAGVRADVVTCDADVDADSKNCGACGHDCRGTPCTNGLCQAQSLFTPINNYVPDTIALDDASVYVAGYEPAPTAGRLVKFPKEVAAAQTRTATDLAKGVLRPGVLVDTADYVYWTQGAFIALDAGSSFFGIGRASKAASDGGLYVTGQGEPFLLAIDGTAVYWNNVDTGSSGDIWKAGLGPPANEQRVLPARAAIDLAVDGQSLYYAVDADEGSVVRCNKDGSSEAPLATMQFHPRHLALDDTYVYWTTFPRTPPNAGVIRRVAKTGGAVADLVSGQTYVNTVLVDATSIYWTTQTSLLDPMDGKIWKAPKAGGAPLLLATGLAHFNQIAVDDTHVYFTNSGTVLRVPK